MNEKSESSISSETPLIVIVLWCMPLVIVAYFDVTLTALFSIPILIIAVLYSQLAKRIISSFQSKVSPKLLYSLGPILATIIVLISYFQYYTPEKLLTNIIDPTPESIEITNSGGQLSVFGISSFYAVFNVAPSDFNSILENRGFGQKDINNISGRKPELYKRAIGEAEKWVKDISEIYVKDEMNSSYRCTVVITNKQNNKVYYRIF